MKRLLIILIFLQIILPAKSQAQVAIDSNGDVAINLQSMSVSMSNKRCAKVEYIRITDNGEYTTATVFHYGITAADTFYTLPDTLYSIATLNIVAINMKGSPHKVTAPDTIAISTDYALYSIDALDFVEINTNDATRNLAAPNTIYINTEFALHCLNAYDTVDKITAENMPRSVTTDNSDNLNTDDLLRSIATTYGIIKSNADDALKNIDLKQPVEDMHLSDDGYSLLEKLEGYAPSLYNLGDGGYTIGFGFFVPYNESYKWAKGVTWEQAVVIMRQKVPAYEAQVKEYVNVPITQSEFDALTMLAYNIGGFLKASSIINDINEEADLTKLQSDWKKFIHSKAPNVSKGLMNRRKDEMEVRKESNYQPDRKIQVFKK